ncbi:MAG: amidohydrolase family protein [Planctomycetota bacterium]|nr:amidohydrolase family protein [Planctomycetota bacterium]
MKSIILNLLGATFLVSSLAATPVQFDHPIETDVEREPALQAAEHCIIRNATIHTATRPAFVGDVHVSSGKITGVGLYDGPFHEDAQIIDGTGMHLVPGVVDNHSHMAIERGINEGSLSITAEVRISDEVNADDVALYRALAGGVTTIRLLHGSANAIGGQDEVLKLRWSEDRDADSLRFSHAKQGIKFAQGENVKRSNWGSGDRFPATRMGVESLYYRAFQRAREYQAEWKAFDRATFRGENPSPPRKDLRLEALAGVLDGSIHVHSHCYRADEILMFIRASQVIGFQIATLQHVLDGYKVVHEMEEAGVGGSTFSDWWSYKIEAYDAIPHNAALMHEGGVLTSVNSDSDEMVRRLYDEAAKSIRYADLDPVTALQLVTLNSAKQLGIEDWVGSIEVNKDADLVLLNGDPMSAFSRVLWTMVDGQIEYSLWDPFELQTKPAKVRELMEPPMVSVEGEGPITALVGGTVHTMYGDPIENATLLMQGGRITQIGKKIHVPKEAERYDVSGKHLWPGMVALNSSLGLFEIGSIRATVDTREIGGNQPDLRVISSVHADSAHIGITRWNGITRAQVVPSGGGPLVGQSAVIDLDGDTWEEMMTLERSMLHVQFPRSPNRERDGDKNAKSRAEKRAERISDLKEDFENARSYGNRLAWAEENGRPAPQFDPRLHALMPFAQGKSRVALHANNAQTILYALRFAEELELDAVLYGAKESWKVVDAIRASGMPVVIGPIWSLPASEYDPFDSVFAGPAVLARAGIPFAIACVDPENERNLPFNAATAVAYGLPAEEAARAVTLYPARILGLEKEVGSLIPGRRADVVVTDSHLLEITSKVRHVFIDGERVEHDDNRHTRFYKRYRERLHKKQAQDR